MGKRDIKASGEKEYPFSKIKAYSINEILAAGGADAFADKLGKNFQNIESRLKKLPEEAFLTEDEVLQALKTLT
jgi:hypothetical protein